MCYHPNPQLMAMDNCYFQGGSSLHPKDVSEATHVHPIHDNDPLAVVESNIMFFFLQLLGDCGIVCVITPFDGNG
jgi:hypothetical protein